MHYCTCKRHRRLRKDGHKNKWAADHRERQRCTSDRPPSIHYKHTWVPRTQIPHTACHLSIMNIPGVHAPERGKWLPRPRKSSRLPRSENFFAALHPKILWNARGEFQDHQNVGEIKTFFAVFFINVALLASWFTRYFEKILVVWSLTVISFSVLFACMTFH